MGSWALCTCGPVISSDGYPPDKYKSEPDMSLVKKNIKTVELVLNMFHFLSFSFNLSTDVQNKKYFTSLYVVRFGGGSIPGRAKMMVSVVLLPIQKGSP